MERRGAPTVFTRGLRADERREVDQWWLEQSPRVQMQLAAMMDERHDNAALACEGEGDLTEWHALPIQLEGRLADEETRREDRMMTQQLYDYIVNHEEVRFFLEERSYHICRAHPAARAVIRDALLPASFQCPLNEGASCPMQIVLGAARGKSVAVSISPSRRRRTGARRA